MGLLTRGRKSDVDVASCLSNLDRLAAVAKSGLMDRSERARLDQLIGRAATALATPMAFVSILDDTRLVLAGAFGIPDDLADTRETTPEASYCQFVVGLDDVLVVNDSANDPLVADHPATASGQVRAYLGVPVRFGEHCIGSFCVVDTKVRAWTDDELATLEQLSTLAI